MTRWRLVLRLAWRDVTRRPGRTALVALLVALPVAAMVMAVTIIRTDQVTLADEWARYNGAADARVYSATEPELPAGSQAAPLRRLSLGLRQVDGPRRGMELVDVDGLEAFAPVSPTLVEGRAPRGAGEITLTRDLARDFQVSVGEELVLDRPTPITLTVVGLAEDPSCLSCRVGHANLDTLRSLVPRGDDLTPERWLIELSPLSFDEQVALVEDSGGSLMTRDLFVEGWDWAQVTTGSAASDDGVRWAYVLGAVVLTVVGIVISAAFAVGARRQLVALGQLSASGASPSTLRAALVVQGTVTGVLGAAMGLVLAVVALLGLRGVIEEVLLDHRIAAYEARPLEVLAAALVGVGAATLAALIPARTAAKVPTLAALAGRRPLPPVPRRLIAWGTASVVGGLGLLGIAAVGARSGESGQLWAFVAIVGGVAELLGACAIAPAIVARLEPLAARLRGSWRMAARGLARHRTRTGAVVGAVCAAAGLAIAAAALLQGAEARDPDHLEQSPRTVVASARSFEEVQVPGGETVAYHEDLEPVDAALAERIQGIVPAAEAHVVRMARPPQPPAGSRPMWEVADPVARSQSTSGSLRAEIPTVGGHTSYSTFELLVVADDAVRDLLGLSDDERRRLDEVGVGLLVRSGGGRETVAGEWGDGPTDPRRHPVVTLDVDHTLGWPLSDLLVTEAAAAELGLDVEPAATLFVSPDRLDGRQRELLLDLASEIIWETEATEGVTATTVQVADGEVLVTNDWVQVSVHHPVGGPTPFQLELALTALALVFCLFVVGTSLALAAAESKDERDVLTVAGAPPRLLARMAGARAWLLAAIGGLLAVPVGFLPVVVFTRAFSDDVSTPYPLVFPLRTVVVLVLLVPAVVAVVAHTTSAIAQRARPVRVSTAVFE